MKAKGAIGEFKPTPSFQPQCFPRPISEIGVRCRGAVFISSTVTLTLCTSLHQPQHSQQFRAFFHSLEPWAETQKPAERRKKCTYAHTYKQNIKTATKSQAANITVQKNTLSTPSLRQTNKAEKMWLKGRRRQREQGHKGRKRRRKV